MKELEVYLREGVAFLFSSFVGLQDPRPASRGGEVQRDAEAEER
jgi:hypothetical protein